MDDYLDYCLPALLILVLSVIASLLGGRILQAFSTPTKKKDRSEAPPAGPGHSLLSRFDAFRAAAHILTVQITAMPLLLYCVYMTYLYFFPSQVHWAGMIILATGGLGFEIERFARLRESRAGYRLARLAYENKLLTGQALLPLINAGYGIFHEVPCNGRTIDNILIGPKGIFAIQTHTHPRLPDEASDRNIVRYDGRTLLFGEESDHAALEETERIVEQLSEWLSEPLPEAVAIRPILVVPGWTVKRTTVEGMPVVNPNQFASLFQHIGPRPLDPATVNVISERILASCRQTDSEKGTAEEAREVPAPAES